MATVSPSFNEENKTLKKVLKGKIKSKDTKKKTKTAISKDTSKRGKAVKDNKTVSVDCTVSKSLDSCVQEPKWEIDYSESLGDPVPDLYPELADSLKMQDSDTEQEGKTKASSSVELSHCDSEENVQCVPTSSKDNEPTAQFGDPSTSQESQENSQLSNADSQILSNARRKRKLSRPKKVRIIEEDTDEEETSKGDTDGGSVPQNTTKLGTWAQCSIPGCGKWRCLKSSVDLNDVPERWVCSMNADDHFNACAVSQETFDSQDENFDTIYTPYASGAVVWAKMAGYPWWPAMMQEDPDYGYYCETDEDNVTPLMYHVVFFGKDVSRAWVNAVCIRDFSSDDDPEDMGKVTFKGKSYRRQLTTATIAARKAVQLPLQNRLEEYGFEKRFKGPIGKKAVKQAKEQMETEVSSESASSQEISSGGSNYSSQEETKKAKSPKRPPKSQSSNKKLSKKQRKSETQAEGGASSSKKQTGKKKPCKPKETPTKTPSTTNCTDDVTDHSPSENKEDDGKIEENMESSFGHHAAMGEAVEMIPTGTSDEKSKDMLETKHMESPESSGTSALQNESKTVDTVEGESISVQSAESSGASCNKAPLSGSTEKKVGEKRRLSSDEGGGKKRKISKEEGSTCKEMKEKENSNLTSIESLPQSGSEETQKGKAPAHQNKQQKTKVKKPRSISEDACFKSEENVASGESLTSSGSKETLKEEGPDLEKKKQRSKPAKTKNISQDGSVEKETKSDNPSAISSESSLSSDKERAIKKKVPVSQGEKKQTKKATKKKADTVDEQKVNSAEHGTSETAAGTEVLDKKRDDDHKQKAKKLSFSRKKSTTSNANPEVREENCSQNKSMPKLVKAKAGFKPPLSAAETNAGKTPKMPKLVRPQFVSPALVRSENSGEEEKSGEKMPESDAQSNSTKKNGTSIVSTVVKRKAQDKDHNSTKASKKAKETLRDDQLQMDNILSEDIQVEIAEIDEDIASLKKELNESDKSDTSLPDDRFISMPEQPHLSDSPEF